MYVKKLIHTQRNISKTSFMHCIYKFLLKSSLVKTFRTVLCKYSNKIIILYA